MEEISVLPGRVRLRSRYLRNNTALARYMEAYTSHLAGVKKCIVNPYTATVLVEYDPQKTSFHALKNNVETTLFTALKRKSHPLEKYYAYCSLVEKRNKAARKFLLFGLLFLVLKIKHSIIGRFWMSSNETVLQLASAITIIAGYPILKKVFRKCESSSSSAADVLLQLLALFFTLLLESAAGIFVLMLDGLGEYIKLAADTECRRLLSQSADPSSGMAWLIRLPGREILVPVESLKEGELIHVHPGEWIPIGGEILEGKAAVSYLHHTGQTLVSSVEAGEKAEAGFSILAGELKIKIIKVPENRPEADLFMSGLNMKQKTDRYEVLMTLVSIAAAAFKFLLTGRLLSALSVMLVLSPSGASAALSTGMQSYYCLLSRHGIFLRNPDLLEKAGGVDHVIFNMNHRLIECFSHQDTIRKDAFDLVPMLRKIGISKISLLTEDSHEKAAALASRLGVEQVYSGCSPKAMAQILQECRKKGTVMMVGDGLNDIQAMKNAHISVSFADFSCEMVKLHSDCIIFGDRLQKLVDFIWFSRKSCKKINRSINTSIIYNTCFGFLSLVDQFDAFTAKSVNTFNSLLVLLLNRRILYLRNFWKPV